MEAVLIANCTSTFLVAFYFIRIATNKRVQRLLQTTSCVKCRDFLTGPFPRLASLSFLAEMSFSTQRARGERDHIIVLVHSSRFFLDFSFLKDFNYLNNEKALRETQTLSARRSPPIDAESAMAVVRQSQNFPLAADPFPGAQDRQN